MRGVHWWLAFPSQRAYDVKLSCFLWFQPKPVSLKFVPKFPITNIPALVQIMAWRRPGDKPLSEPMMFSLLTHVCVTRLNELSYYSCWIRHAFNIHVCNTVMNGKFVYIGPQCSRHSGSKMKYTCIHLSMITKMTKTMYTWNLSFYELNTKAKISETIFLNPFPETTSNFQNSLGFILKARIENNGKRNLAFNIVAVESQIPTRWLSPIVRYTEGNGKLGIYLREGF